MHQLLYISTSRIPVTKTLLDDILLVSRRNNADDGVTGLLLAGGKRFLQLLEGEEATLRKTYARICADQRHFATVVLMDTTAPARVFGEWAMGSVVAGSASAAMADGEAVSRMIAPITDPRIRGFFDGFAQVKRAA